MKVFQSSIFRSLAAIIVGALLVQYREQTVTWITIAIGVVFFISGVISCIVYLTNKKQVTTPADNVSPEGMVQPKQAPFPVVGIGSLVLGALLALAPNTFVSILMYVLAAVLIIGALSQFYNLATARKFAKIGVIWWIVPTIIFIIGCVTLIKPTLIAESTLFVIGWTMMVYGVIELINSIKIWQCYKAYEKNLKAQQQAAVANSIEEFTEAEVVEDELPRTEDVTPTNTEQMP